MTIIKMKFDRETKNKYVYKEIDEGRPLAIESLYVRKEAFTDKPDTLTIEIK